MRSTRGKELAAGRTREEEVVVVPGGEEDFGKMIRVKLCEARQRSFIGERTSG